MFQINGKYNRANVYATTIENDCISQITDLCNQQWLEGCHIAIMPDTHAGKGCVIGTTIQLKDKICPSLVGVDIGCGMLIIEIPQELNLNLENIDNYICSNIPSGFNVNEKILYKNWEFNIESLRCYKKLKNIEYLKKSIGSLGGGNHFVEINKNDNKYYLVVHSGSRNLGQQVANYYQNLADEYCNKQKETLQKSRTTLIQQLKNEGREKEISKKLKELNETFVFTNKISRDLCYLEGQMANDYLYDVNLCSQYASLNRKYIAFSILNFIVQDNNVKNASCWIDEYQPHLFEFGFETDKIDVRSYGFETIHNYIGVDGILRKGAISARENEKVIIPINMRDGSIIGIGKGNPDYNFSGPHGAGRLMSRNQAKEKLGIEEFSKTMEGIYSSSVCQSTIDESPMAYKSIGEIIDNIQDSVEIIDIIAPIYNFKAH